MAVPPEAHAPPGAMMWAIGSWSRKDDLALKLQEVGKDTNVASQADAGEEEQDSTPCQLDMSMSVHCSIEIDKFAQILRDPETYTTTFKEALKKKIVTCKEVVVKRLESAGSGLLLLDFTLVQSLRSLSGGLLFDGAADFAHDRIAACLLKAGGVHAGMLDRVWPRGVRFGCYVGDECLLQ